jgi:hypothetical protein
MQPPASACKCGERPRRRETQVATGKAYRLLKHNGERLSGSSLPSRPQPNHSTRQCPSPPEAALGEQTEFLPFTPLPSAYSRGRTNRLDMNPGSILASGNAFLIRSFSPATGEHHTKNHLPQLARKMLAVCSLRLCIYASGNREPATLHALSKGRRFPRQSKIAAESKGRFSGSHRVFLHAKDFPVGGNRDRPLLLTLRCRISITFRNVAGSRIAKVGDIGTALGLISRRRCGRPARYFNRECAAAECKI